MKCKLFVFLVMGLLLLISSCSTDDEVVVPEYELSEYELEVVNYFKEVALGFEYGGATEITRKWGAPMKIYIDGNPSLSIIEKVEHTVNSINQFASDGFSIEIVNDTNLSNCYLFFGAVSDFVEKFPDAEIGSNYAIFNVWWNNNTINKGRIFIDTNRPNLIQQESLVLEEITQALGFGNDSPRYSNSIFYETPSDGGFATEYSELDKELIRLLYHPDMRVGLNENEVDKVLRHILGNK